MNKSFVLLLTYLIKFDIFNSQNHQFRFLKMKFQIIFALFFNLAKAQRESCGVPNDDQINLDPNSCQLASPNQFPWHVGIGLLDFYFCGGSVITDKYILTSAHCIEDEDTVDVLIGGPDDDQYIVQGKPIPHPDYDTWSSVNDIALIELERSLEFGRLVQPICISNDNDYEDQVVIEIGAETYARATFWRPNDCYDLIGTTETNICPDVVCDCDHIDIRDGLALVSSNSTYQQIGVRSFVYGVDCHSGYPDVYTEIFHYLDWISSVTEVKFE